MDKNYTIESLKGPDRVRKRPAVVFGDAGKKGALSAVITLLDIFITEAALGFSKELNVVIHKDNSISVRSFDRGFKLDETIIDDKPAWYYDFCELFAGPREPDEHYYFSVGSHHNDLYGKSETIAPKFQVDTNHGYGLCAVQYISKFMHVESTRDGIKKSLDFKNGYCISGVKREKFVGVTNTYIHFLIDDAVFEEVDFSTYELDEFLRNASITLPGLKCELNDERNNLTFTHLYPTGTSDYINEVVTSLSMPIYENEIEATGKDRYNYRDYDAKVNAAITFVKDYSHVFCLHNYRHLERGGEHFEALKKKVINAINREFIWDFRDDKSSEDENNYYSRRRFELSFDDISKNIVLILASNCSNYASDYHNATQKSIKNRMITDMAADLISKDFENYLHENHDEIFPILEKIQKNREINDVIL